MNKELKQKWIDALRSGRYQQGRAVLRQETPSGIYHCCLGVLADVSDHPRAKTIMESGYTCLPTAVSYEFDINTPFTQIGEDVFSFETFLMRANDADPSSEIYMNFNQIADWIEENIPVDEDA